MHPPRFAGPLAALSLAIASSSCGARRAEPTTPEPGGSPSRGDALARDADDRGTEGSDANDERTAERAPTCPKRFADAERLATCTFAVTPRCFYGDSACSCEQQAHCGGAPRAPTRPGDPGAWLCSSTDPKRLDREGCPFVAPRQGDACVTENKRCFYGRCLWLGTSATCVSGAWRLGQIMESPPP